MQVKLTNVEAGFARVRRASDNRTLGFVSESKEGSTRTGTMWTARFGPSVGGSIEIAMKHTRAEAVNALVAYRVEQDASFAAAKAKRAAQA